MRIGRFRFPLFVCVIVAAWIIGTPSARAATTPVWGGPTYDQITGTGYRFPGLQVAPGSTAGNGAAVGFANKYAGVTDLGLRAVRWDASGAAATELANLGTDSSGRTASFAFALNSAGVSIGYARKYTGDTNLGLRAVRWNASGTIATELDNLGTSGSDFTNSEAYAVNTGGVVVGYARRYTADSNLGNRAVRWDASSTLATELGNLGTSGSGSTSSLAYALNDAGVVVGQATKYTAGTNLGNRAVRWAASGTTATELGNLGTDSSGFTGGLAHAVNPSGVAVGWMSKYTGGTFLGGRAVRWDASGTTATELDNLGTDSGGYTSAIAYNLNNAGTVVGYAFKYTAGTDLGTRAVRWDASGTAATALGDLGTDSSGRTDASAFAINTAGVAVGSARKYSGDTPLGNRALLWNFDALAIDLNTLIDPASGWTLSEARDISDTNWVSGIGLFDPDGAGPLAAYDRAFLLDVSSAVPEPSSLSMLALSGLALLRRRRR